MSILIKQFTFNINNILIVIYFPDDVLIVIYFPDDILIVIYFPDDILIVIYFPDDILIVIYFPDDINEYLLLFTFLMISMKHVESKLFSQNGHFYFSFQIYIYIYILQTVMDKKSEQFYA